MIIESTTYIKDGNSLCTKQKHLTHYDIANVLAEGCFILARYSNECSVPQQLAIIKEEYNTKELLLQLFYTCTQLIKLYPNSIDKHSTPYRNVLDSMMTTVKDYLFPELYKS